MAGAKTAAYTVVIHNPDAGASRTFQRGDEVPGDWAKHVTNPAVFGEGEREEGDVFGAADPGTEERPVPGAGGQFSYTPEEDVLAAGTPEARQEELEASQATAGDITQRRDAAEAPKRRRSSAAKDEG